MPIPRPRRLAALLLACLFAAPGATQSGSRTRALFARDNLVAWCIVPFDAVQRGPEERARMVKGLGLSRIAYDWRAQHVAEFADELSAYDAHGIECTAFWGEHPDFDALVAKGEVRPQFWTMIPDPGAELAPEERVAEAGRRLLPRARRVAELGCGLALYNHGGWAGEPATLIAVCRWLREATNSEHVGIVYNLHHGHDHIDDFEAVLAAMTPYLFCLNLNGMNDGARPKIVPLAQGTHDERMLRAVVESDYAGPIGILDHDASVDSEARLADNLAGLDWLVATIEGRDAGPRPVPTSYAGPMFTPVAGPEYRYLPAIAAEERTPAGDWPAKRDLRRWHRSHGDAGSTRFSALDSIHRGNVAGLEVAWTYRSGDGAGNIQCNPIVFGDLLITPTPGHRVVGVDARTGEERWGFTPGARPAHRGLMVFPGDEQLTARLLFTAGPALFALDPTNGEPIADFGENGRAALPNHSTAGVAVFEHTVVVPGFDRDVFGLDLATGALRWTFHTIPQAGEPGHETWTGQEQGANCWGGFCLDPIRGLAFFGTGSPKPNFDGTGHLGDNLFANCVVALDVRTGERVWHFQELRHDIWDLDLPASPNLVTLERDGQRVDAVACVTKIGNTLLLDRLTGKPLFPVRLRRAPESTVPGERAAAWQPAIELPVPFARQEFTLDDVTDRTPEARQAVLEQVQRSRIGWFQPPVVSRPVVFYGLHGGAEWTGCSVSPEGRLYVSSNELPWIITLMPTRRAARDPAAPPTPGQQVYAQHCAVCHGPDRGGLGVNPPLVDLAYRSDDAAVTELLRTGRNLMPPAPQLSDADRTALLDYLFDRDLPQDAGAATLAPGYTFTGYHKLLDPAGYPGCKPPWGTLNCVDLNSGALLWQVPLGEYPELTAAGMPLTGTENFGGPTATAGGLVFVSGTRDARIRAFDSDTGEELWSAQLPFVGTAPPTVYESGGRQFVVVPATGGGKLGAPVGDAFVAFALPDNR